MEGYQQGERERENGVKVTGNKKHKWQVKNRQGEVKNSMGMEKPKTYMYDPWS